MHETYQLSVTGPTRHHRRSRSHRPLRSGSARAGDPRPHHRHADLLRPDGDLLAGEENNDIPFGQKGNDELWCGSGTADVADGGQGTDWLVALSTPDCETVVDVP